MGGCVSKQSNSTAFDSLGEGQKALLTKMAFSNALDKYYRGDARVRGIKSRLGHITSEIIESAEPGEAEKKFYQFYNNMLNRMKSGESIMAIEQLINDYTV
ncbi:hypothetical protein SAMN03159353_10182 [Cedecea sp. NFIX57]|nr:hypothetical protein SAMN03159353_10182 [Cedecea sp. NFIX57]